MPRPQRKVSTPEVEGPFNRTLTVRSFVRRHADHYFACCIDLNLAAEGETVEVAMNRLRDASRSYLNTVLAREGIEGFRHRPAPLSVKTEYHWLRLKSSVTRLLNPPKRKMPPCTRRLGFAL